MMHKIIGFILCCLMQELLFAHGLVEDRLHGLNHEIELKPLDDKLYLQRGRVHQERQNWNVALADYQRALDLNAHQYESIYWQGMLFLQRREYRKAEHKLKHYLKLTPKAPAAHSALAQVYFHTEQYLKSAQQYQQAIQSDKNAPPALYAKRVKALLSSTPISIQEIENTIAQGIHRHGKIITFIELSINTQKTLGNYTGALTLFNQLPVQLRTTPRWLLQEAELLHLAGNTPSALRLYKEILRTIDQLPAHKRQAKAVIAAYQQAQSSIEKINRTATQTFTHPQ